MGCPGIVSWPWWLGRGSLFRLLGGVLFSKWKIMGKASFCFLQASYNNLHRFLGRALLVGNVVVSPYLRSSRHSSPPAFPSPLPWHAIPSTLKTWRHNSPPLFCTHRQLTANIHAACAPAPLMEKNVEVGLPSAHRQKKTILQRAFYCLFCFITCSRFIFDAEEIRSSFIPQTTIIRRARPRNALIIFHFKK